MAKFSKEVEKEMVRLYVDERKNTVEIANIFGTYNYLINEVIPALDSATLNLQNKKD